MWLTRPWIASAKLAIAAVAARFEPVEARGIEDGDTVMPGEEIGALKAGDTSVLTEKIVVTYEQIAAE